MRAYGSGLLLNHFGFLVPVGFSEESRVLVENSCEVRVVRAKCFLGNPYGACVPLLGLVIPSLRLSYDSQSFENLDQVGMLRT